MLIGNVEVSRIEMECPDLLGYSTGDCVNSAVQCIHQEGEHAVVLSSWMY